MLHSWDIELLRLINIEWTHPLMDPLFLFVTSLHQLWIVRFALLPLLITALVWWRGAGVLKVVLVLIVTVGASDLLGYRLIKPLVARPRPFLAQDTNVDMKLGFEPGGGSFPSNHALNSMAAATLLGAYVPGVAIPVFCYSLLVGYSRVYLGVHYPSDVLVGWLIGIFWAWVALRILRRWPTWAPRSVEK